MQAGSFSIVIIATVFAVILSSCNGRVDQHAATGTSFNPDRFNEGDTLSLDPRQDLSLTAWISYHRLSDSGLNLTSMPASGVIIHLDPMDTINIPLSSFPDTVMAWSPDRSRYLDIWSYNHILDTLRDGRIRLTGGGPEQIVALGDLRSGQRHILMFNGTGQIAESVDWLDDQTFVIGMMLFDEATGERTPDIMLFSLKDSVFTDFRYLRAISGDSLPPTPGGFMRQWLQCRGLQTE